MSNDKYEIARLRALIENIQQSPPGGGDVTQAELDAAIVNFPTRVEVSGAITASGGGPGGVPAAEISGAITASIANRPTRTEVTGALGSYATLTGLSASFATKTQVSGAITGAISNFPTRTEASGAITASLAGYARTDQQNYFSASQSISGNLFLSGSRTKIESQPLLDLNISGAAVSGTQLLMAVTNSSGVSQLIGRAGTVLLLEVGNSGSWPYYVQIDAQNKFVALEADDVSGSIYLGGTGQNSSVHIGSAGDRSIFIGNTSASTVTTILGNVTFASGTVTGISGAGGVSAAQVTGAISGFPTRTEVTGALTSYATLSGISASFTTAAQVSGAITGGISNRPTRTEVTGALNSYATLTGVSASFTTPVQVTSSFSVITASVSSIGTITTGSQTLAGAKRGNPSSLTSTAASIAIDLSLANFFTHTTTEDTTLAAPSNAAAGQSGAIIVTQGATPRTLSYNSFWKFAGGTLPSLTATSGAVDVLSYYIVGSFAVCAMTNDVK
jgi:hypothetical protein